MTGDNSSDWPIAIADQDLFAIAHHTNVGAQFGFQFADIHCLHVSIILQHDHIGHLETLDLSWHLTGGISIRATVCIFFHWNASLK
jgi:hypothetical protein